jgi:hypothetical protein
MASLAERAQKLTSNMSCVFFVFRSFAQVPRLGMRCNKRCQQSGNGDLLLSPWFVAGGVLTAAMQM